MILWYAAGAVFAVWAVFQTTGLDFRLVALGALCPLLLDLPFGHMAYAHSLLAPVAVLTVVMFATMGRGRRLRRRRAIGVPIGWMCGLALSGAFAHTAVFWWPTAGPIGDVPLWPGMPWPLVLETLGLVALRWMWLGFGLGDPHRRQVFLRTGRLVAPEVA